MRRVLVMPAAGLRESGVGRDLGGGHSLRRGAGGAERDVAQEPREDERDQRDACGDGEHGLKRCRERGDERRMLASTVTGVIDRLEAAGLVQRERDSRDRRIVWVVLTGDGEELVGRLPSFFEHLGKAFTVLPARELEQMRESLLRALAAGEDEGER